MCYTFASMFMMTMMIGMFRHYILIIKKKLYYFLGRINTEFILTVYFGLLAFLISRNINLNNKKREENMRIINGFTFLVLSILFRRHRHKITNIHLNQFIIQGQYAYVLARIEFFLFFFSFFFKLFFFLIACILKFIVWILKSLTSETARKLTGSEEGKTFTASHSDTCVLFSVWLFSLYLLSYKVCLLRICSEWIANRNLSTSLCYSLHQLCICWVAYEAARVKWIRWI